MMKVFLNKIVLLVSLLTTLVALGDESHSVHTSPVMVFVSFSMSDTSLKEWMRQAEKIHAPIVIRGLINNSFKDTIKKMAELTKDNHGGIQIDPTLYRRFQINAVPAVVVWNQSHCNPTQTCMEDYDVIYGDVTLEYALNKVAAEHDRLSSIALHSAAVLHGEDHA